MKQRASWGVVATMAEPLPLVAAFVAHYLELGASELHLYFDRPDPDAEALFSAYPQVQVIQCDAAYWETYGSRPGVHTKRQQINANRAYRSARVDWLLHCDTDELLQSTVPPAAELAALPDACDVMWVEMGERVFEQATPPETIFDGIVMWPLSKGPWNKATLAPDHKYLQRGMTGHVAGKSFFRTGKKLFVKLHGGTELAADGWADHDKPLPNWTSMGQKLVHFDGMSVQHFALKLRIKAAGQPNKTLLERRVQSHRMRQIEYVLDYGKNQRKVAKFFESLRVLSQSRVDRMRALGCIAQLGFDPVAAVSRCFPDHGFDYSIAAFDAETRRTHPDWF